MLRCYQERVGTNAGELACRRKITADILAAGLLRYYHMRISLQARCCSCMGEAV
jgi:hypothetical protein